MSGGRIAYSKNVWNDQGWLTRTETEVVKDARPTTPHDQLLKNRQSVHCGYAVPMSDVVVRCAKQLILPHVPGQQEW